MTKFIIALTLLLSLETTYANMEALPFSYSATDSYSVEEEFYHQQDDDELKDLAEANATPEGRAVLVSARTMIENQVIILGSCWDYIHEIFNRAGYPLKQRLTPYKMKKTGPYASVDQIKGGDWLYFINHSFGGVEHSAIFVEWIDLEAREALMISYAGGNREAPARYKTYDLSSVYNIIRAKPKKLAP
ncbi:MAG TPA: hypothetical protein VNJ01_00860 [Bacteriovoracaceae bacterium]|nr:hypothetical protein [Bacteriovoracaceae bacterium]